jgi:hypothetical protein
MLTLLHRLGEQWTDKKSICNKFLQSSPITCLIWPRGREDVVFGLAGEADAAQGAGVAAGVRQIFQSNL